MVDREVVVVPVGDEHRPIETFDLFLERLDERLVGTPVAVVGRFLEGRVRVERQDDGGCIGRMGTDRTAPGTTGASAGAADADCGSPRSIR